MYIVERTSETEVSFIVCNTGQGVGYHPGVGSDKIKRHTCMRLNNIPLEKITDTVWLYFLFRIRAFGHKDHDEKIFYEVVLPGLLGCSLETAVKSSGEDPYMIPETLQRSGVCYYRCILTAMRYSMRRLGLKQDQVKQMLHIIRRVCTSCDRRFGKMSRISEYLLTIHLNVVCTHRKYHLFVYQQINWVTQQ